MRLLKVDKAMTNPEFAESLRRIEDELHQVLNRRERILKDTRDIVLGCSKAIVLLHSSKPKEAQIEIQRAGQMLDALREEAGKGALSRYLVSPEAEFVEASTLDAVLDGEPIPSRGHLKVSNEAYLLGLLDTIGELKRLLVVSITKRKVKKTLEYFRLIEELYSSLSPFAVYDNVVSGIRRKIDVARMITEDCRGILAEETRRESLMSSISRLERTMKKAGRDGRDSPS